MNFENEIKSISLEGFQVVDCRFFSRSTEPIMTLFPTAIAFNVASQDALNRCESVEILVNEKERCIIIRPAVNTKNTEAIKWRKDPENAKYSRVECTLFGRKIYSAWSLNEKYSYKTVGKLVQCDRKVMLLFDFSQKEAWQGSKLVKENI